MHSPYQDIVNYTSETPSDNALIHITHIDAVKYSQISYLALKNVLTDLL